MQKQIGRPSTWDDLEASLPGHVQGRPQANKTFLAGQPAFFNHHSSVRRTYPGAAHMLILALDMMGPQPGSLEYLHVD